MLDTLLTVLLLASTLNLALMIPGGFVEVRDFSAYPAFILGLFNTFLTVLGLGGLVLAYFIFRHSLGYGLGVLIGCAYIIVYLADLRRIFPVSPVPMSRLLARLEWLGTILGIALAGAGLWAALQPAAGAQSTASSISPATLIALIAAGLAIIAFATRAATQKKNRG